jgi:uncharacterized protein involved in outer membrane biogenesis
MWPAHAGAMTNLRKITLAVVSLSIAAAVVLGSHFKSLADKHREQVQQELRGLLGDRVQFDGLDVRLFWWPGFVVREFRIADDSRFAATPIIKARELVLGISLVRLLAGRIVIDSLSFVDPEIQVITEETGLLNLSVLASQREELGTTHRRRSGGAGERRQSTVRFAIDEIRADDGRIIYLDRTVKDRGLQLRDVELKIYGLDLARHRVHAAASLTEGLGQICALIAAQRQSDQSWYQRSLDLKIQFDSLYAPVVLPPSLTARKNSAGARCHRPDVAASHASGSLLQPRLDDVTLKIPLFGSSDTNAVVSGKWSSTKSAHGAKPISTAD